MAQNIGSLFMEMGVDTSGLEDGFAALQKLSRQTSAWAAKSGEASEAVAKAFLKQEVAITRALEKTLQMQAALTKAKAPTTAIEQNAAAFNQLAKAMSGPQLNTVQFTRAQEAFRAASFRTTSEIRNLAGAAAASSVPISRFGKLIDEIEAASVIAVGPLSGIGSRIRAFGAICNETNLKVAALIAGVAAMSVALYKVVGASITASREMQSINAVFKAATGSTAAAATELQFVIDVSQKLGVSIQGTAKQYALFLAATKNTNITADQTRVIFEGVLDASSALQLDTEQTAGVFKAFTDIVSKGTFQMEEMRGQLGDRLPGALQILASAFGITVPKLIEMAKHSQLSADNLSKVGERLKTMFEADAIRNADNLNNAFARLQNSTTLFFNELSNALGIAEKTKAVLNGLAGSLDFMRKHLVDIPKLLAGVAAGLAFMGATNILNGIKLAGGAIMFLRLETQALFLALRNLAIISAVIGWFTGLTATITATVGAFRALVAAFGAWEAIMIVATTGIAGLGAALGMVLPVLIAIGAALLAGYAAYKYFSKATEDTATSTDKIIAKNKEFIDSIKGIQTASSQTTQQMIADTGKQLMAVRLSIDAQVEKINELTRAMTDSWALTQALKEMTGFGATTDKLKAATEEYNKQKEAVERLKAQLKELNAIAAGTGGNAKSPIAEMSDKQKEAIDDALRQIMHLEGRMKAMAQGPKAVFDYEIRVDNVEKIERMSDALRKAGVDTKTATELTRQYARQLDALIPASAAYDVLRQKLEMIDQIANNTWKGIEDGIMDVLEGTRSLGDVFSSVVSQMLRDITRFYLQSMFLRPSGQGSFLGDLFGALLAGSSSSMPMGSAVPKRAIGGPVTSGRTYLVGEKGPELFMPASSGSIIPHGVAGGGGQTIVNVNVVNKAGNTRAEVSESNFGNTRSIDIIIDEIVASKIGQSSSKTNKALRGANEAGGVIRR